MTALRKLLFVTACEFTIFPVRGQILDLLIEILFVPLLSGCKQ